MIRLALLVLLPVLFLMGCESTNPALIKEVPVVFEPDPELYECPTIRHFPDIASLTDGDIAELLLILDENNNICARSLEEIKKQIADAKKRLEGK